MNFKNIISTILLSLVIPVFLLALPQDLDVFIDFENVEGSGTFTIGEPPNRIQIINFTLETEGNPSLSHSGSKALVLIPGQQGIVRFERGVHQLQFYAAETTGGGRLEINPHNLTSANALNGLINGVDRERPSGLPISLQTSINPGANPPLLSYISFTGDVLDRNDLNYANGIIQIKIVDASGQFALDDLGFTYIDGPGNNTVFEDFENISFGEIFMESRVNFTIGQSPVTATFTDAIATKSGLSAFNHSDPSGTEPGISGGSATFVPGAWLVDNGTTGTITFETPAAQVQFYAAVFEQEDGLFEVFDTEDNLIASSSDIPQSINTFTTPSPPPFTFLSFNAAESGAPDGISKITYTNSPSLSDFTDFNFISLDDFGFTPISDVVGDDGPFITTQPASQEVQSGTVVALSIIASGDDLSYQWFSGNSGDTASPIAGATGSTFTTSALNVSTNFWVAITNVGGTADSDTAVITVVAPSVPLVLEGTGDIAGENIQHPNGNIFDQVLLTGESIRLQARPNQITRVSFMDENEDIVQVEFSGAGAFTVTLDAATFLPPAIPPRYNQTVEYVTGKPSIVIDGADANTFFSIFTVGSINAVNQALFPEGQVYDAQADVSLVEVINSSGIGGMQLSNTVFGGSTGKVGIDARGVPIAVRLTIGDIDASGDAVPHLLFGTGSFTVPAGNPGLRITGGDLAQSNGASIVVAESGSTTPGFETLITQNNFKSDNTPQPTRSINATFANEDGNEIAVAVDELTIE